MDWDMSAKKSAEPSPASISRANRQRLAHEEGARAMAEFETEAVKIRKNMQRLRALREAKEASEPGDRTALAQAVKKKRKKRIAT
jgi:hypothetical protein